jgi:hypothetical protein
VGLDNYHAQRCVEGIHHYSGQEIRSHRKDLCRPGTVVTLSPTRRKPEYDDLVALYQGKELFRYRRF